MRYFELIEEKVVAAVHPSAAVSCKGEKTKVIRIPAGSGPVQIYIRRGKVFIISAQPSKRSVLPDPPRLDR